MTNADTVPASPPQGAAPGGRDTARIPLSWWTTGRLTPTGI